MIGGMRAALGGLQLQQARFDQAAARMIATTAAGASPDAASVGAGVAGITDASAQMATAQYALVASFRAAQASNEMVAETLRAY